MSACPATPRRPIACGRSILGPVVSVSSPKRGLRRLIHVVAGVAVVAVAATFSAPAAAQEAGVSYKRKTVINFEDDTIEGDLKTPDGQYLEASKKIRHKTLIRIREDFRREVLGSISDL